MRRDFMSWWTRFCPTAPYGSRRSTRTASWWTRSCSTSWREREIRPEFNMSYDGTQGWHDWMRGVPGRGRRGAGGVRPLPRAGFPPEPRWACTRATAPAAGGGASARWRRTIAELEGQSRGVTPTWRPGRVTGRSPWRRPSRSPLDYIPCFYEDGAPLGLHLGGFFMGSPS